MSHAEPAAIQAMVLAGERFEETAARDAYYGVVQVGGTTVAIAATHLIEAVDRPADMLAMPQPGGLMQGMFILRGRIIPVVDLSALLTVRAPAEGAAVLRGQVAVISFGDRSLGIAVDAIGGVMKVPASQITSLGGQGGLFDAWIAGGALGANAAIGQPALPILNIEALLDTPGIRPTISKADASRKPLSNAVENASRRKRYTLARVGGTVVALDFLNVPDISPRSAVKSFFGSSLTLRGMVAWRGAELLLVDLAELLGFPRSADAQANGKPLQLVVQDGDRRIALEVDALLGLHYAAETDLVPLGGGTTLTPECYQGALHTAAHGIALVLSAEALLKHPLVGGFLESSLISAAGQQGASAEAGLKKNATRCTYLIFQAGGGCATPLADIDEILAYDGSAKPIDNAGNGMCGLIEQRGKPLELFDLRHLLGRTDSAADHAAKTRVLVVTLEGRQRGFLVDRLVSLITTAEPAPQQNDAALRSATNRRSFSRDRFMMLGEGAEAVTCERVDLKSLMAAAAGLS